MSIAIIANPSAGRGRGRRVALAVEEMLTNQGVDFELQYTAYHRQGIDLARQAAEKHEIVAALGGDGTIGEVLEGIWQTKATLGIIPGGTGNDYARGLGVPRDLKGALDNLLDGHAVEFDVGVEQDKTFGVLAAIGFPVTVIEHVNNNRDGRLKGPLAILVAVFSTLRTLRSYPVKITVDGKSVEREVVGILAMNMPYGGGGLKFAPDAKYNDGQLSVVVVDAIGKGDLAITLPKVYSGKHIGHPAVTILRGREIQLESEPLTKMFDGDFRGTTPLNARLIPKAAKVIVPKTPA